MSFRRASTARYAGVLRRPHALFTALAFFVACGPGPEGDPTVREGQTPSGIAYDVAGRGPAIVLVHGAMLDRRQWIPQQTLTEQFTVIRYDTRWHGRSDGADSSFRAADDLAAVLDAAGVDRASIVGLSNGARIAVDFALANPARVDRLVLVSPGLGGYRAVERQDFWGPMSAALADGNFDSAATLLAGTPIMVVGASDSAWVAAMVREQAHVFSEDPSLEQQPTPPAIARLGEIKSPTLVITGTADLRDIVLTGDTLVHAIGGAQRVEIPGARHLLTISHAAEFNRIVSAFLSGKAVP